MHAPYSTEPDKLQAHNTYTCSIVKSNIHLHGFAAVWVVITRRHKPEDQYLRIMYHYEMYVLEQAKLH
jgi:hypothetical protein